MFPFDVNFSVVVFVQRTTIQEGISMFDLVIEGISGCVLSML